MRVEYHKLDNNGISEMILGFHFPTSNHTVPEEIYIDDEVYEFNSMRTEEGKDLVKIYYLKQENNESN